MIMIGGKSMFVKIYTYHVEEAREDDYLNIQAEAEKIYTKFVEKKTVHLRSKEDHTKWMEIHTYKDKESYQKGMKKMNELPEIQELYSRFLNVIMTEFGVKEEDFEEVTV